MAFDLTAAGGYGTGNLGDYNRDDLTPLAINWSANVTAITNIEDSASTLTLADVVIGANETPWTNVGFTVGTEVFLFVDGNSTSSATSMIGRWIVATITASTVTDANGGTITVNKNLSAYSSIFDDGCVLKVINIPHFKNLTLNDGSSIVPNFAGNPVVFKCSETLTFNGGHIKLNGFGHSVKQRPLFGQETGGKLDTDKYAGWENSMTKDRFLINCGDGAAFIIANNINVANTASRIGNPNTTGVAYCRGASDSYNVPSGVTNIGGSTILLVAGTFTNFTPRLIAKYRTGTATDGGAGLARCYIASGTKLTNDEGLYAYDNISKPSIVTGTLKIKNFGDGSYGSTTASVLWNNYAAVTAFNTKRNVVTVKNMTTAGTVQFDVGALVMVHAKNKDSTNTKNVGRFYTAKILGVSGNAITLDTAAPYNTFNNWLDTYYVQIITIPQFTNFAPKKDVGTQIPAWKDDNGYGGIFAIACNGICNLSDRAVNVMGKGGGAAYGTNGLTHIGNAQDNDRLPIGQGFGSAFILAKNLVMNSTTRIGATWSGAVSDGGKYGGDGGYKTGTVTTTNGGGYQGKDHGSSDTNGTAGGGATAGICHEANSYKGGYGSNASGTYLTAGHSQQGAHIMIIADTITGFNQAAISTGGGGGLAHHTQVTIDENHAQLWNGKNGSAGYGGGGGAAPQGASNGYYALDSFGGGGGYNGGGGGSTCHENTTNQAFGCGGGGSGWAFIYCNNVVDQDTTDTVVD